MGEVTSITGQYKEEAHGAQCHKGSGLVHRCCGAGYRHAGPVRSAIIGHKRGREYEAIADTDYPAGEEVDYPKRTVDSYYGANVAQSKFIYAYAKEDESSTTSAIEPPPKRRRRDTGAKVSFNEETYVRDEADIDNLRWEYGDERRSAQGRSASMPLRRSTVKVKNDSRPRRSHFVRPLQHHSRGTGRRYFKRRDKT